MSDKVYVEAKVRFLVCSSDVDGDKQDEILEQLADKLEQINEIESGFVSLLDNSMYVLDVK